MEHAADDYQFDIKRDARNVATSSPRMQFLFSFAPLFTRFALPVSACPLPRQPFALAARSELCRPCPTCLLARSILLFPSPVHYLLARPIDAFVVFCVRFFFCNPLPSNPSHITNSLLVLIA